MDTSQDHTPLLSSHPPQGDASTEQHFPTLAETSLSPMASDVHKAKVRAALFCKVEPIKVGRFTLLERLGAGAMGEIYAAYDEQLDRRVALKLCRPGSELTVKADHLLLREAQALAQVSHPNVVQIYEVGTHEGRPFIAMELVRGQTLTRWLEEAAQLPRPHRQREILRRFIAAGRGLEAAHAAGVAHRDFKPDNVLVGSDGRVRVVDFGLARVLVDHPTARSPASCAGDAEPAGNGVDFSRGETLQLEAAASTAEAVAGDAGDSPGGPKLTAATRLTRTGMVMGTPRFMAPEQIRGGVADHRSDQFSFCVALYHALYREFPFAGKRPQELLDSIETGVSGLEHSAGVAAGLRKTLRRGLSVDPEERFASMGELLATLEPGMRWKGVWITGAVLLFVATVAVALWKPDPDPCSAAGDAIASVWSAERQKAVRAAFSRSDQQIAEETWPRIEQRIRDYVNQGRDGAIAACRATRVLQVQSEQQLDRRMLCLERSQRHVMALVSELARGAPEVIEHAVDAAQALPDLRVCSHTESMMYGLEPPSPALAGDVAAVQQQIAHALTLERLGRSEDALAIARGALATAGRLGYRPVQAEALAAVGRALEARGNAEAREEAEGLYFQALDIAEAKRHDVLAAMIWGRLVLLATQMDAGTKWAHARWRRNEAAVARIGGSDFELAKLHHRLAEIHYRDGKFVDAVNEEKQAIASIEKVPEQQLELSRYYDALAKSLEPQERLDEALRLHAHALEIAAESLGSSHPRVITLQINYARALMKAGQLGRARSLLETTLDHIPARYRDSQIDAGRLHGTLSDVAAVAGDLDESAGQANESLLVYQRAGAPDHLLAEAHTNIGNVEMRRKNFEAALTAYQASLELRRPYLDSAHYQLAVSEASIADALLGLSRFDEAMQHVGEAERIFRKHPDQNRDIQAWFATVHGELLLATQQPEAAVPELERALALFVEASDPSNPPRAMWALARALHGLGKDPARVKQLAGQAARRFTDLGAPEARNREAVEQFMARLLPRPASSSPTPTRR